MSHLRLATALVLLALGAWPHLPAVVDDLYISYAYALSLVETGRLVWQGAAVEGYSNFAWVLLLAGARLLALPVTWVAKGAALVAAGGLVVLAHREAPRGPAGTATVLALGAWGPLATWAGSGMETTTFALLAATGWGALARERTPLAVGLLAAAAWTRPEGSAWLLAAVLLGRHTMSRLAWGLVAAVAGYHLWRLTTFGGLLPTSVVAKLGSTDDPLTGLRQAGWEALGVLPLLLPAFATWAGTRRAAILAFLPAALHLVLLLGMNGDWMGGTRILLPGVLGGLAAWSAGPARPPTRLAWLTWLVVPALLLVQPSRQRGFEPRLPALVGAFEEGAPRLRAPLVEDTTFVVEHLPPGASFETGDIGLPGLVPGVRLLDSTGLVDPVRAAWLAGLDDGAGLDARYTGPDALTCVRRYLRDPEVGTPRFQAWIRPYRLVAELRGEGQRHRWWCRPDMAPPSDAEVLDRWLALLDRVPELPEVRWHAARALADAGRWEDARATWVAAPTGGETAEAALLLTRGSLPDQLGPRGFVLLPGGWMRTRPLDPGQPAPVDVAGPPAAHLSLVWTDTAGAELARAAVDVPGRVTLDAPARGARARFELDAGSEGARRDTPVQVRAAAPPSRSGKPR